MRFVRSCVINISAQRARRIRRFYGGREARATHFVLNVAVNELNCAAKRTYRARVALPMRCYALLLE